MKKMAQKNLFYSVLLATVMLTFLVGYFTLMLPSLYVAYMKEQDLESIKLQPRVCRKRNLRWSPGEKPYRLRLLEDPI